MNPEERGEINETIGPDRLAAIDQWHARLTQNIDGLITAARADVEREEPVSKAVEVYLMASVVRAHPVGREGLADLLAALLVEVIRSAAEAEQVVEKAKAWRAMRADTPTKPKPESADLIAAVDALLAREGTA